MYTTITFSGEDEIRINDNRCGAFELVLKNKDDNKVTVVAYLSYKQATQIRDGIDKVLLNMIKIRAEAGVEPSVSLPCDIKNPHEW